MEAALQRGLSLYVTEEHLLKALTLSPIGMSVREQKLKGMGRVVHLKRESKMKALSQFNVYAEK